MTVSLVLADMALPRTSCSRGAAWWRKASDRRGQRRRGGAGIGLSACKPGRELHRLLGKKTLETELLKEALERAMGSKQLRLPPSLPKDGSR